MPDTAPACSAEKVSAELTYVSFFNLAFQQNALPVIYELKITNHGLNDLEHLECRLSSKPEFICEKRVLVERLRAGETLALDDWKTELRYDFLAQLSERIKGELSLEISGETGVLFQKDFDCEIFAPDQWLGMKVMPELLASFVTPNLEAVTRLQSSAAQELERATGSASISGYQAGRTHVYNICGAIYRAIHNWGIQYSNPASSFGTPGQRIRFADAIYRYKLGTCLDTALLFASVMEACGLHPVIMLQKGHAYVGCHLENHYFQDIPMDDLQAIRKRADLDEFLVLETTMVTGNASFEEAEACARSKHLNIDDDFECAIDVVRARYSGILPLPLRHSVDGVEFAPVDRKVAVQKAGKARSLEEKIDLAQLHNEQNQPARVIRWTKKLLDLSLRNRLLNVRDTKLVIPLACSNIAVLEDKIADNKSLTLNSLPNLLSEKDLHDLSMLRNTDVRVEIRELLDKELSQQRLWTMLQPGEMSRRMTALYRQGKTDQEEGGVNTVFLALGFVEWKAAERDQKSYLAPILLLPVQLKRLSVSEGIRISRVDGDTIINETLLELFRSQFRLTIPGISPLPTDDSGVDVGLVMQIFRQAIKEMKGWEIREDAVLGHFSFGKFVMWTDMTDRLEALKKNPLIEHLISGSGIYDDGIEVFPPEKINDHLDLSKLYCPVSADSSQLAAVLYSEIGKSFVLHGPPGTGKSQTITNIIAHNLAQGKKVLFVSEKKAALDVVYKRLSQIGLKPFCLELHSNRSGKAEVLAQFSEALQTANAAVPTDWEDTVRTMTALRAELDTYAAELHSQYPNGFSAYDCFSRLLGDEGRADLPKPKIDLEIDLLAQSREDYAAVRQKFIDLADARRVVDAESMSALELIDTRPWSPVTESRLLAAANDLLSAIAGLKEAFSAAAELFDLPEQKDIRTLYRIAALMEMVKGSEDTPGTFFCDDSPEKLDFIAAFTENAEKYAAVKAELSRYRLEKFPDYDFPGIAERLAQNEASFFLLRFIKNRMLLKELAGLKKSGSVKLSVPELKKLLPDARQYVECRNVYESGKARAAGLLGSLWNEEETPWELLAGRIALASRILGQVRELAVFDEDLKSRLLRRLQTWMPDISRRCARDTELRTGINRLLEAWNAFQEKKQVFLEYSAQSDAVTGIDALQKTILGIVGHIGELRNVLRCRILYDEVASCGWSKLAEEENGDDAASPGDRYDHVYFRNMLDQILARSPALCNFSGATHNERIRQFGEIDARYMSLTKKLVFARLAANLPRRRSGPCPEGTELGTLKRECEKRARQKPVRMLLEQIPTIVPLLKPCFLMSPLSVAQYLPADTAPFDLIVFDEASQIPVWDAIGVIARGRQLIVVGDPKQMPPTNFFQKGESGEEDAEEEHAEDAESILDECIVAGLHSTYLNWHYRSRHESLIAFSNHHYYDDRLFTFPAARSSDKLGVRFEFVPEGVYDSRASRTNRKEAEALVEYVFSRLKRSGGRFRSIGIVTFSQAQKDLIENLVDEERRKYPELEAFFSDEQEEPPFVKNLENVQGDERDVILFSIGYAPDAGGHFSMNFGPLNRQGGERRLNVAITRAKEQVVVFSSIHADQIDLARTNAVGARHLKYFLDYAEKKTGLLSAGHEEAGTDGLGRVIEDFLTGRGFTVERNIGCSGFRIDLAVRCPDRPGEFLAGIECDNAAYAAQNTTRDRDNLRQQVLKGLGWHIRAWSVDWTLARKWAENDLLEFIERAGSGEPEPPGPVPDEPEADEAVPEEPEPVPSAVPENRKEYILWKNDAGSPSQEMFYEQSGSRIIRQQIKGIIAAEAPIYERLIRRRVARAWGFTRLGGNIQKILDDCMPSGLEVTQIGEDRVVWAPGQSAAEYKFYRVGGSEESRRAIDEIPPEELANAMYEIVVDFKSCEKDTLFRETVRLFGLSAVTARARKYLEFGFTALKKSGRI